MAHKCSAEGCTNFVFSNSFCKYHQYFRRRQGGDLHKRKKSILKEGKKRKVEKIHYAEGCKQLAQEIRDENNGKIHCFFTGIEITGTPVFHHLLGRSGSYYTDKDLLVPCDNEAHLFWHRATVEQLQSTEWYEGFLKRLKNKSLEAYNKETRRFEKAHKLNPAKPQRTIWDELTD